MRTSETHGCYWPYISQTQFCRPEERGGRPLRKVGNYVPLETVSYPRRLESASTVLLEHEFSHEVRPLKYKTKKIVCAVLGDRRGEVVPVVTSFSIDMNFSQFRPII